jgi:hypothetical protein
MRPIHHYKFSYVYRIDHPETGQYYIGLRSCNCSPEDDKYMGSGIKITRAIESRGIENFKKTILEVFTDRTSAAELERSLVDEARLEDPLCLNLMTGGEITQHTKKFAAEVGDKISTSIRESFRKNPELGKAVSKRVTAYYADHPEAREKVSQMRLRLQNDPEHVKRNKAARQKLMSDPATRQRIIDATRTPESLKKRSETMKKYASSEEGAEKIGLATADTTYMNLNGETRRIKNVDVDSMIKLGWILGSALITSNETRTKLGAVTRGRKWMYHPQKEKAVRVKTEDIDSHLNSGWLFGQKKVE